MGNEVTLSEALVVTAVSMLVVFLVLILISFLIGLLKTFSEGKKKDLPVAAPVVVAKPVVVETPTKDVTVVENNEELVAVVAAAIAASLGLNIPDINIKSIRRIPQNSAPWTEMSKQEQLLGKL